MGNGLSIFLHPDVLVFGGNKDRFKKFTFGGREVTPIHLLLLLGEMEGVYQHLKYMGFEEDMNSMEELKKKYYKLYFQKVREENESK